METSTVHFEPNGASVRVRNGSSIYQASLQAGVSIGSQCGGNGKCGKCRVIILDSKAVSPISDVERAELTREDLRAGIRLACQARILRNVRVKLLTPPSSIRRIQLETLETSVVADPMVRKVALQLTAPTLSDVRSDFTRLTDSLGSSGQAVDADLGLIQELPRILRAASWRVTATLWNNQRLLDVEAGDTTEKCYGAAVDIGTSKIAVQLVNLGNGQPIGAAGHENPQLLFGEDIVERAKVLEQQGKLDTLRNLVVATIDRLLNELAASTGTPPTNVYEAVVVGNTVMHHIFLGIPPRNLCFSPFIPTVGRALDIEASELGLAINPRGVIHLPPNVAGFVGADAVADLIASGMLESQQLTLLLDIGTNTEAFLGNKDGVTACSCASGPAFEGAHIAHGMRAVTGAIERVKLRQDLSAVEYATIDNAPPRGLCGSAVIDIVAELFRHGVLTDRGALKAEVGSNRVRLRGKKREFLIADSKATATGKDIVLTQDDVNEILLAKAAIYTACSLLMKRMGVQREQIQEIVIGGALGSYLNAQNAIRVGMLPAVSPDRISARGNLALLGARLLLTSRPHRQLEEVIPRRVKYIELTVEPNFSREFAAALFIPHKD